MLDSMCTCVVDVDDECLCVSILIALYFGNSFELSLLYCDELTISCLKGFPFQNLADSSVTTQPDRYLIIVTSGGLNQQRTGVRCISLS